MEGPVVGGEAAEVAVQVAVDGVEAELEVGVLAVQVAEDAVGGCHGTLAP